MPSHLAGPKTPFWEEGEVVLRKRSECGQPIKRLVGVRSLPADTCEGIKSRSRLAVYQACLAASQVDHGVVEATAEYRPALIIVGVDHDRDLNAGDNVIDDPLVT